MTVYFLCGLGADQRTFKKLNFPVDWIIKHVEWLPVSRNETLVEYCLKISQLIKPTERFSIVGLSFGGIVAVELSKILHPQKTIIISSIATRDELPVIYKVISYLKLNKIVPASFLTKTYPFTYWFFGVKSREEKLLLNQIITDTSSSFLQWAINEVLNWDNTFKPGVITHIHGTKVRIFPFRKTTADIKINGGGHFMIYTKAKEINKILIKN